MVKERTITLFLRTIKWGNLDPINMVIDNFVKYAPKLPTLPSDETIVYTARHIKWWIYCSQFGCLQPIYQRLANSLWLRNVSVSFAMWILCQFGQISREKASKPETIKNKSGVGKLYGFRCFLIVILISWNYWKGCRKSNSVPRIHLDETEL